MSHEQCASVLSQAEEALSNVQLRQQTPDNAHSLAMGHGTMGLSHHEELESCCSGPQTLPTQAFD